MTLSAVKKSSHTSTPWGRKEERMTLKSLASAIAKLEGKKSQTHIGNIREALKVLRKLIKEDPTILDLLKPKAK